MIALIAFYICNLLIYWTGWLILYKMMLVLIAGLGYYLLHCYFHKQALYSQCVRSWWLLPYFCLLTFISWLGSFGQGMNIIPFGYDCIAIGLLSIIIFYCALATSRRIAI
jgi:hypothetical protein